ncbi:MAG: hypothetical protein JWP36_2386 [Paucimonas sp.]|nr:hypothetical protein [Paucimonas sp.]
MIVATTSAMRSARRHLLVLFFLTVFLYALGGMSFSRHMISVRGASSQVGDGNLAGDPAYYNRLALKKAAEMRRDGISRFELRPSGQAPAGMASALYLFWQNPLAFVTLNALMHALSAVFLVLILRNFFPAGISLVAALPLAISPYLLPWFSQLNKESLTLLGSLIYLYGLLRVVGNLSDRRFTWLGGVLFAMLGVVALWTVRPYLNQILLPATIVVLGAFAIFNVRGQRNWAVLIAAAIPIVFCLAFLGKGAVSDQTLDKLQRYKENDEDLKATIVQDVPVARRASIGAPATAGSVEQAHQSIGSRTGGKANDPEQVLNRCAESVDVSKWGDASFLPASVNGRLRAMMILRCGMFRELKVATDPATIFSFFDQDRYPSSSVETLGYLPRAAMYGLFAPWADRWGYVLTHQRSTFYTIVPLETFLFYVCLIALFIHVWQQKDGRLVIPLGLAVCVITVYGLTSPFIGALYRYRYPWWMLLLSLGLASAITIVSPLIARRKHKFNGNDILKRSDEPRR